MNNRKARLAALALGLQLIFAQTVAAQTTMPAAQTSPATSANKSDEATDVEPKFIWGFVIRYVAGEAFSAFSKWLVGKITDGGETSATSFAGNALTTAGSAALKFFFKGDTTGGAYIARNATGNPVSAKDVAPTAVGEPSTPIRIDNGTPNYQGVHIAVIGIERDGSVSGFRAVKDGFHTGERFKLRVVSTFSGVLAIDNINPRGERKQIYPASREDVVVVQPAKETVLPLGKDEFFEFARTTGEEQLVISLRDPRAIGGAASNANVFRKDENYGSNFVQEVGKETYPAISESIRLMHQ